MIVVMDVHVYIFVCHHLVYKLWDECGSQGKGVMRKTSPLHLSPLWWKYSQLI